MKLNKLLFEFVEPEAQETEADEKMAEKAAEDKLGNILRLDHGGE